MGDGVEAAHGPDDVLVTGGVGPVAQVLARPIDALDLGTQDHQVRVRLHAFRLHFQPGGLANVIAVVHRYQLGNGHVQAAVACRGQGAAFCVAVKPQPWIRELREDGGGAALARVLHHDQLQIPPGLSQDALDRISQ